MVGRWSLPRRVRARATVCVLAVGVLAGCSSSSAGSRASSTVPPSSPTTGAGAAPSSVVATAAAWRLPAAVSRAVVCTDGTNLVILGGLAPGDTSTDAVWKLDPAGGGAQRAGRLARAVHDAGGTCRGGGALVFGGGSVATVAAVQDWSPTGTRILGTLPQPRSDLAAASLNGRTYVVGGFDGTDLTADILATVDGSRFSVAGQLAVPVRYPAVAAAGGKVWVVGGQLGTGESTAGGGQTDAIQRFDPTTGRTVVVGHLPEALGHASALDLGGRLIVAGGRAGAVASDRIWVVDTLSGAARPGGVLPGAVSDAGAVAIGATGWLVGGELSGPAAPLDTVVELRLGRP